MYGKVIALQENEDFKFDFTSNCACSAEFDLLNGKQELGVAAADIKKLRDGGINTVEALAHAPKKELLSIKGISEAKVEKIQKEGELVPCKTTSFCAYLRQKPLEVNLGRKNNQMHFSSEWVQHLNQDASV